MGTRAVRAGQDRDPVLAKEVKAIRAIQKRAEARAKALVADAIEIGRRLERAKKRIDHGQWLPWLRKNFDWSEDTAERYMRVHRHASKFRNVRNLNANLSALYLLTQSPPEVTHAVIARGVQGETITPRMVKLESEITEREYRTAKYLVEPPPTQPKTSARVGSGFPFPFIQFLRELVKIADVEPPTPTALADAVRAGRMPDGLTSGHLRAVANMLLAFATALNGQTDMPRIATTPEGESNTRH